MFQTKKTTKGLETNLSKKGFFSGLFLTRRAISMITLTAVLASTLSAVLYTKVSGPKPAGKQNPSISFNSLKDLGDLNNPEKNSNLKKIGLMAAGATGTGDITTTTPGLTVVGGGLAGMNTNGTSIDYSLINGVAGLNSGVAGTLGGAGTANKYVSGDGMLRSLPAAYAGTAISGVSVSGNNLSLTNTGITAGSYGGNILGSIMIPALTLSSQGRVTGVTNVNSNTLPIRGDVTGTLNGTTVSKIQSYPVSLSTPTNNQVLTYNGSTWVNADLPVVTAGGSTVTTNTLTASSNILTSTVNGVGATATLVNAPILSSSGNTLGMSINGQVGNNVNLVNSFSLSTSGNQLSGYVNGVNSPVVQLVTSNTLTQNAAKNLISTVNNLASAPLALLTAGDVIGDLGTLTVAKIQGTAVGSTAPTNNQVLTYDSGTSQWRPSSVPGVVTGNLTPGNAAISITGGSGAVVGSGAIINVQNATTSQNGLLTAADFNTFNNKVSTVFGRTGAITALLGDYNTDLVTEGLTNLYYTNARADSRITAQKSLANGLASLDSVGKVPLSQLPAFATGSTFVKTDLNTTVGNKCTDISGAVVGDICVATGENKSYVLGTLSGTVVGNWIQLLFPTPVQSVNGLSGVISLNTDNINEGVTNQYYTDARSRSALSVAGAPLTYNSSTGVFGINQANTTTAGFLGSTDWNTFNNKLGSTLASSNIFVGNGSNVATGVLLSGDATINNSGALTIANNAVTTAKINAGAVDLTTKVTGILPIANGGTGSATQNFVDLTTPQTVAGNKSFSGNTSLGGTLGVTGNTTLSGTLGVTGNQTNAGSLSVGTTLGVTGATTLSTLNTSGLATLNSETVTGNSTIGGNSSITGTLGVTGLSTLASLVNTGSQTMNGIAAPVVSTAGTGRIYFDSTSNTFKVSQNAGAFANLSTGATANTLTSAVNTLTSNVNGTIATAPIINTNTLTSTVNTLSGSVNGINATGVNIINSNTVSTSANLLTSTVNGIASATAPIINTNLFTQNGTNQIISTINGVASTPLTLAGFVDLTTAQTVAGNKTFSGNTLIGGTLGVTGATTLSTLTASGLSTLAGITNVGTLSNTGNISNSGILTQTGASTLTGNTTLGSSLIQNGIVAPAVSGAGTGQIYFDSTSNTFKVSQNAGAYSNLRSGPITNTLGSTVNTITSTVDGTAATASLINSVANNSAVNTLTTTVNGVAGTGVNIINTNTITQNGTNQLISTINGVASSALTLAGFVDLTTAQTVAGNKTFSGNSIFGGTSTFNGNAAISGTNNFNVGTGATTLGGTVTISPFATAGIVKNNAAGLLSTGLVSLTTDVTAVLPIANGGTGSATQNFVDLTTAQGIAGNKNFNSITTFNGAAVFNGIINAGNVATTLGGTLAVAGPTTLSNSLTVNGITNSNLLTQNGNALFSGVVQMTNTVQITGATTLSNITTTGSFTQNGIPAPAVSSAGTGRIYFDSTSNNFQVSQNGGAFASLRTGAPTNTLNSAVNTLTSTVDGTIATASIINTNLFTQNGTNQFISTINGVASTPLTLAGFVDLTTAQTVAGNKTFSGNTAVGGTLGVTGNQTNTGSLTVGTTLGVTGATTLGGNLSVTGNTTNTGTLTQTGNATLAGTLAVTGISTLTGNTTIAGTTTLQNALSVTGATSFKRGTDYSTIGTTNDVVFGNASLVRLTGASAQTITGIAAGTDGQLLTIINAAAQSATISNQSVSSLAANRITTGTGTNLSLAANASVQLIYDTGASLWRVVGGTGGGSSSSNIVTITDLPTGGVIGTAAATVDITNSINVTQSTASQTLTLPNPTNTTAGKTVSVNNTGTAQFTMYSTVVTPGTTASFSWNGTTWLPTALNGTGNVASEFGEVLIAQQTPGASSGVYADLPTPVNFTIPTAGTWEINYVVNAQYNSSYINFVITDSSNNPLNNNSYLYNAGGVAVTPATNTVRVTTTGPTIYKLRYASNATFTVYQANAAGGGGVSRVFWNKVSGYAPVTGQSVDYVYANRTTGQTTGIAIGSPIIVNNTTGGNIPNSSGVFSLTAGKTYNLTGAAGTAAGNTARGISVRFRDITNNVLLGTEGASFSPTGTQADAQSQSLATAVITPTTNITVRLEIVGFLSGPTPTQIGFNTDQPLASPFVMIQQLGSSAVIAGSATPFNTITAAQGTSSIDNTNYDQAWNWNTETTGNALALGSSSLTAGNLLSLNTTNVAQTGSNLLVSSNTAGLLANGLVRYNLTGAYTGNGVQLDTATLTGNGMAINANTLTSGNALAVGSSSTTATGSLANLTLSGNAATNTASGLTIGVTGALSNAKGLTIANAGNGLSADIQGAVAFKKGNDYSTIGITNNVALGNTSLVRLTGASSQTITGIVAGKDGQMLTIMNTAAQAATISNNSASSLAANRIVTGTGADLNLTAGASIQLMYDITSTVWRIVGGAGGGSSNLVSITDLPTGGVIGTAAATVDITNSINITQSTASQTLTLPNPTNTTTGKTVSVNNTGSNQFTMYGTILAPGNAAVFSWNGTTWLPLNTNVTGTSAGEFGTNSTITDAQTTSSTTYTDVLGGSFTLPSAGTWNATYAIAQYNSTATADDFYIITDSSNNPISNSEFRTRNAVANDVNVITSSPVTITTTGATTYKLRWKVVGGTALIQNGAGNNSSRITWQKVSGYAPVTGQSVDYMQAMIATGYGTNLTTADHIKFDTVVASSGNINLDVSAYTAAAGSSQGRFLLKAGKTYRLEAKLDNISMPSWTTAGWYTDSGTLIGQMQGLEVDNGTLGRTIGNSVISIYTPTVDTRVEVRVPSGTTTIQGLNDGVKSVSAIITQLGSSSVITGNITPALNQLVGATGTNAIDNGAFDQNWSWNGLAAGNGLALSSSSTTATGSLSNLTLSGNAATNTATAQSINIAGATSKAKGLTILNAGTGLSADIQGAIATRRGSDYVTIGTTNDVSFGNTSFVRLTGASAQTITGIVAGTDGQLLTILNAGTTTATLSNANVGSLAANRITTGTGSNLSLAANASVQLIYDSGASLWRVVGGTGGGSTNSSATLGDFATGGVVGTAVTTVDTNNNLNIAQTTAGQILSLPNPTVATAGKVITVSNTGTALFTMYTTQISTSSPSASFVWNGTTWNPIGGASNVASENGSITLSTQSLLTNYPAAGDIAGSTFTLPSAGTWEVGYYLNANNTGSLIQFLIADSANTVVVGSSTYRDSAASFDAMAKSVQITTTGAKTYKIRYSAGATSSLSGSDAAGSGGASNVTWTKISGNSAVTGQSADYVNVTRTTNQPVAAGGTVIFDSSLSGNIPYNTATGVFTLSAGKTYKLTGVVRSATAVYADFVWVDATSGVALTSGNVGGSVNLVNNQLISETIYTPTTNQTVKLNSTPASSAITINGSPTNGGSYANITQLGSSSVIAGNVTPALNQLVGATGTNVIDNTNFGQTWNWSGLTTGTGMTLGTAATNSLTTGSVLDINTSSTALNSTNGLFSVRNTGTSTSGLLARFQSNSTAGSGLTVLTNGFVGVGTVTPGSKLELAGDGTTTFANSGLVLNNNGTSGRKFGVSSRNDNGNGSRFSISDETAGVERLTLTAAGTLNLNNASSATLITGFAVASNQINAYTGQDAMTLKGAGTNNVLNLYSPQSVGTAAMITFVTDNGTVGSVKGNITSTGATTAYNTTSDSRLKSNQRTTAFTLDDLMKIQVKDYTIGGIDNQTGFIAQQLDTVFPQAVTVGGSDPLKNPWTVDYGKVTPLLAKSIQDLNKKVDALGNTADITNRLTAAETKVNSLTATTNGLTASVNSLTTKVDAIDARLAALEAKPTAPAGASAWDGGIVTKDTTFQGTLTLDKTITVNGMAKFLASAEFQDVLVNGSLRVKKDINIEGNAKFASQVIVGDNTATVVTIKAGQTKVHLDYTKAYKNAPVITATPKALITGNFAVVDPTLPSTNLTGFDLVISQAQATDVQFNVISLGK